MDHIHYYSYTNPGLELRPTGKKGQGLFATLPIAKEEVLGVWGGEIRSEQQLAEMNQAQDSPVYGLQVEEGFYLWSVEENDTADFFNHSCDPNAGMSGQIILVAMRDIAAGEEVCFDYAMTDGSPYDEFTCHCGAPNCRGQVTGSDWKIPELQERYRGYFSPYLQRRIDALKQGE